MIPRMLLDGAISQSQVEAARLLQDAVGDCLVSAAPTVSSKHQAKLKEMPSSHDGRCKITSNYEFARSNSDSV